MNDAMYIAATGMQAHQLSVDTIANNLANINTPGFKMTRVSFQDMMYRESGLSTGLDLHSIAFGQGMGVSLAGLSKLFSPGELRQTDNPLDVAIQGSGFLEVAMPDGTAAFSRGGSLQINHDGFLTSAEGNLLKPNIHVGNDAKSVTIGADGRVMVVGANQTTANEVGRIEMVNFSDPSGLTALGHNLYTPSERSGDASFGKPGEDGFSQLAPGFIEASNVKLVDEMVNLLVAQRAYGMSVKVIQAADDMAGMSNNLRR
jgi:flagellar basal-body rod protein FlgG